MLKIGLVCNTPAAFPLLQWCHQNQLLAGVAILNTVSDFAQDTQPICSQNHIPFKLLDTDDVTTALVTWQKDVAPDLVLVLAFPFKISPTVFKAVPLGYFNIHFGKLPTYAGSFPLFWQIIDKISTGTVTIHQMDENFDSGPLAIELPFQIERDLSYGMLESHYGFVAIHAVHELLTRIIQKTIKLIPQPASQLAPSPKPVLKDLIIQWEHMTATNVTALILATNPWNKGAIALINGLDIKILDAMPGDSTQLAPGTVYRNNEGAMAVACQHHTSIIILIVYCHLGYFERQKIWKLGLQEGDCFQSIQL